MKNFSAGARIFVSYDGESLDRMQVPESHDLIGKWPVNKLGHALRCSQNAWSGSRHLDLLAWIGINLSRCYERSFKLHQVFWEHPIDSLATTITGAMGEERSSKKRSEATDFIDHGAECWKRIDA